jgi:hypothetical protein
LANWNSSSLVLKLGEIAIAEVPNGTSDSGLTPPAIGIKVGDGTHTFSNLPWIQAAAGDVYGWAKAATKPTYAASEITGLSDYINGIVTSGKDFRIVKGNTASDSNTYYLESKYTTDSNWTRDTVYTINLESMDTRLGTLETWADTQYSLADQIMGAFNQLITSLSVSDTAVEH